MFIRFNLWTFIHFNNVKIKLQLNQNFQNFILIFSTHTTTWCMVYLGKFNQPERCQLCVKFSVGPPNIFQFYVSISKFIFFKVFVYIWLINTKFLRVHCLGLQPLSQKCHNQTNVRSRHGLFIIRLVKM